MITVDWLRGDPTKGRLMASDSALDHNAAKAARPRHATPNTEAEHVAFRLLCIGVRKYSADPGGRGSAAMLMLTNALRLAIRHCGARAAAEIALSIIEDERRGCS